MYVQIIIIPNQFTCISIYMYMYIRVHVVVVYTRTFVTLCPAILCHVHSSTCIYCIARNIGGDLNLADRQFGKKTTKLNST